MVKRHYQVDMHSSVKEPSHGSLIYFDLKIEGPKAAKDGKDTHELQKHELEIFRLSFSRWKTITESSPLKS